MLDRVVKSLASAAGLRPQLLDPIFAQKLRDLLKWRESISVTGATYTNTPTTFALTIPRPPATPPVRAKSSVYRMRVTEVLSPTAYPELTKAKRYDGTSEIGDEVVVRTHSDKAAGGEFLAARPVGGVTEIDGSAATYEGDPVLWEELGGGGIPAPAAKYQVYTPVDDTLVPIWTTARFQ